MVDAGSHYIYQFRKKFEMDQPEGNKFVILSGYNIF